MTVYAERELRLLIVTEKVYDSYTEIKTKTFEK